MILTSAMLVACDNKQRAPDLTHEQEAIPAQKASQKPEQETPSVDHEVPETDITLGKVELDFSLPADVRAVEGEQDYLAPENQTKLPDLFDALDKPQRTRIDAELLRDEHNPDIVDSIEGINLTIEKKLGD